MNSYNSLITFISKNLNLVNQSGLIEIIKSLFLPYKENLNISPSETDISLHREESLNVHL